MNKRPTLLDLARAAGVSRSTAARAMSGTGYVDDTKKKLIEHAAAQIGYSSSAIARALRTQRSNTVGILIADISNPIFPKIVKGADEVLSKEGITILLCNTEGDSAKQRAFMRNMLERRADGLILVSQSLTDEVAEIVANGPPSVFVNRTPDMGRFDYVGPDNIDGIERMTAHLMSRGHQRIGYIGGPRTSSTARERLQAFRDVMDRNGLVPTHVIEGEYDYDSGWKAAGTILAAPERSSAIMAANDFVAMGVIARARKMGIRVPDDLAVTGYDGAFRESIWESVFPNFPMITTILQPRRAIGNKAAALLLRRMEEPGRPPVREIVPIDFCEGSTS